MHSGVLADAEDMGDAIGVGFPGRPDGFAYGLSQKVVLRNRFNRDELAKVGALQFCLQILFVKKLGLMGGFIRILQSHDELL